MRKKNLFKEFDEVQNYIGRSNARYYIWKLTDTLEQIKFIGTIDPYLEKVIEDLRNKVQKVTGKEAPFKIKYGTNSKKCNRIVGSTDSARKNILELAERMTKEPELLMNFAIPIVISGFTKNTVDGQNRIVSAYIAGLKLLANEYKISAVRPEDIMVPVVVNRSEALGRTKASSDAPDWDFCNFHEEILVTNINRQLPWKMSDTKNRNRNSNNEEVRKNQQIYDSIVKNCKGIPSAAISKIFYPEINNRIRSIMKTCPVELKTTVDINRRISSVTRMMEFQIALTHVTAITSFGESNRVGRITGFIKAELDTNLSKTEWKRLIEDMHHEKNPEWFSMWETTKVVCGKTSIVDNGLHDETANYGIFVSLFNKYKKKK